MRKIHYAPAPGFHISAVVAQIHGEAQAALRRRLRRPLTSRIYERYCADPRHVVHESWLRKKREYVRLAGRRAALYFLQGVILITNKSTASGRQPKFTNFVITAGEGQGYAWDAPKGEVLKYLEGQFVKQIHGLAVNFANVAGTDRMLRAIDAALVEFRLPVRKPVTSISAERRKEFHRTRA